MRRGNARWGVIRSRVDCLIERKLDDPCADNIVPRPAPPQG
jgi:hypothetical protein